MALDMNIDLKNLNMSDLKDKILKLADKKTLIKIGIISGAIIFFLIIYYAILSPMVETRKVKLDDMNLKKEETIQFTNDVSSMKKKITKRLCRRPTMQIFKRNLGKHQKEPELLK